MSTSKTHIGRQEELIEESGVQLRATDPLAPVQNQIWINTSQQKLKYQEGLNKIVLADGDAGSVEIDVSNVLDFSQYRNFYKTVSANLSLSLINIVDGMVGHVFITNTNSEVAEETEITFPAASALNDSQSFNLWSANDEDAFYAWLNLDGAGIDPLVPDKIGIPVNITKGLAQVERFICPAGTAITTGQYFNLWSANDVTAYYVWFNKDLGGGDPLIVGKTGIQVPMSNADTATQVAEKLRDAIDAIADFNASFSGANCDVTNIDIGPSTDAINVSVGGLTVTQLVKGVLSDTPAQVATKFASAINDLPEFNASSVGAVMTVENADTGFTSDATNNNMGAGFSINVSQQGSGKVAVNFGMGAIADDDSDFFANGDTITKFTIVRSESNLFIKKASYDA